MGFCGQCGAQAAHGVKFCHICGHKLPAALEGEVFCFACPAWCSSLVQWSQWNNTCATGATASIRSTATTLMWMRRQQRKVNSRRHKNQL